MSLANATFEPSPQSNAFRLWAQLIPLVLLVIAAYWVSVDNLIMRWSVEQEYSHGFLIPVVSAWMIWSRRKALESTELKQNWIGFVVLAAAAVLAILGVKTSVLFFQQIGLVVSLYGVAMIVGGWKLTRLLAVPFAFLFFMIPLPDFMTASLSWRLQLTASELGVLFIRLFNVPVFLDGNVIDLGVYKLGVVEACSGLRYMFPFLSLSFLAAYSVDLAYWKKIIIVLSAIPITIIMNSIRIGFIGVLVHYYGIEQAEGFIHYFEGWVVFAICIAILIAEIYAISWLSGNRKIELFKFPEFSSSATPVPAEGGDRRRIVWSLGAAAALVALGAAASTNQDVSMAPPESAKLIGLPYEVEDWKVIKTLDLEVLVEEALAADDYVGADLLNTQGDRVNLFVAYIQRKRNKQTWHSPRQCIPGGGWEIESIVDTELVDASTGNTFTANRVMIERNGTRQLVYYWFQQRGRRMASEWAVRYYVMQDSLLKGRSDGALVRLVTQVEKGEDVALAEERLKAFTAELTVRLPKYVPE